MRERRRKETREKIRKEAEAKGKKGKEREQSYQPASTALTLGLPESARMCVVADRVDESRRLDVKYVVF